LLVLRTLPVNFDKKDSSLFEHEFSKHFDFPKLSYNSKVFIDSSLCISHFKNFSFINLSIRNLRTLYNIIFLNSKIKFQKKALIITDEWTYGYFHWFMDCLPKLLLGRQSLGSIPILLPGQLLKFDFVKHSLDLLEISDYYFIESKDKAFVNKLYNVTYYPFTGNYLPFLIKDLRSEFLKPFCHKPFRNIYITRNKASKRRVLNESIIFSICKKLNIDIVYCELLSFYDQVKLFSECKNLISIHGAGLTNMLFMNSGSKVLELRRIDDKINNCYFSLASALDLHYYYLLCNYEVSYNFDCHNSDYIVNEIEFEKLLLDMLNEKI
jgi:capsular polysaccharide biosynthesis protein